MVNAHASPDQIRLTTTTTTKSLNNAAVITPHAIFVGSISRRFAGSCEFAFSTKTGRFNIAKKYSQKQKMFLRNSYVSYKKSM